MSVNLKMNNNLEIQLISFHQLFKSLWIEIQIYLNAKIHTHINIKKNEMTLKRIKTPTHDIHMKRVYNVKRCSMQCQLLGVCMKNILKG